MQFEASCCYDCYGWMFLANSWPEEWGQYNSQCSLQLWVSSRFHIWFGQYQFGWQLINCDFQFSLLLDMPSYTMPMVAFMLSWMSCLFHERGSRAIEALTFEVFWFSTKYDLFWITTIHNIYLFGPNLAIFVFFFTVQTLVDWTTVGSILLFWREVMKLFLQLLSGTNGTCTMLLFKCAGRVA